MLTTSPLVCRIFINTKHDGDVQQNGWSMRVPLRENYWPAAWFHARDLTYAVRNILASDMRVEYAALGHAEYPWYEQALIEAPLTPLPQWGPSETDTKGLWLDFYDGKGEAQGHLFRGIAQNQYVGTRWILDHYPIPDTITSLPADLTTATPLQLFHHCFTTFKEYSSISRKIGPRVDGVQQYKITTATTVQFVRVSSRRVGYPWHRLSWEAVPWTSAPPFSPCGMVVGVGRGCFLVRAIFYPGGPTQWIHYYASAPDAQVFPLPHIWWGRFGEQDLFNSFGVGELTGNTRRTWATCTEYGNAPADHYSGPVSGFTGNYLPTWTPIVAPPADLLPACDNPGTKGGDVEYGGFGVGGPGIMWDHLIGSAGRLLGIDSFVADQGEESMEIDSLLAEEGELTPDFESLLAIQSSQILKIQSVLANEPGITLGIQSSLRKTQSLTLGIDSYLQGATPPTLVNFTNMVPAFGPWNVGQTTAPGKTLIMGVNLESAGGSATMDTPSGWTLVLERVMLTHHFYLFTRVNAPSVGPTITFTLHGSPVSGQGFMSSWTWAYSTLNVDQLVELTQTGTSITTGPTATLASAAEMIIPILFSTNANWALSLSLSGYGALNNVYACWGAKAALNTNPVSTFGQLTAGSLSQQLWGRIITFKQ